MRSFLQMLSKIHRGAARPALLCAVVTPLCLPPSAALAQDAAAPGASRAGAAKETVRPELGPELQAAQSLIKDKKYKEALARLSDAEAAPNLTPYERFVIDSLTSAAATYGGEDERASKALESMVASGRLAGPQQLSVEQALAVTSYRMKRYDKAEQWAARYVQEGGAEPAVQDILVGAYYYSGDFKAAAAALQAGADADEKAGRTTREGRLQMLLNSDLKIGDSAGAGRALEKLLTSYPQKRYWEIALSRLARQAGFAERLNLDLLRLQGALGDLRHDADYALFAQLSMQAGFPAEAKSVLEQGFAAGVLDKGSDVERNRRLLAKATKDAADDEKAAAAGDSANGSSASADGLLNTGYNDVLHGRFERGLALMEQGLKKGGLRQPEDAKLHLGIAYWRAGDKSKAAHVLRSVQGADGTAELARLWAVYAEQGKHG